jgi:hypothetical protein
MKMITKQEAETSLESIKNANPDEPIGWIREDGKLEVHHPHTGTRVLRVPDRFIKLMEKHS